MAEEVRISGTDATAKVRNPLGTVALSIVTIGVYYVFWWYFINREMRDLGRARGADLGQNPGQSVLAITLGALIIVPALVTLWRTSARVEQAQEVVGIERRASGPIIFVLLLLIGPVGIWYAQSELGKVWEAERQSGQPQPASIDRPAEPPPAPEAPVQERGASHP